MHWHYRRLAAKLRIKHDRSNTCNDPAALGTGPGPIRSAASGIHQEKRRGDGMRKSRKWSFTQLALLPIALASQLAQAQSSVTLYGVVDESFRFITNANKAGDSSFALGNGGMTQSRWGLKG